MCVSINSRMLINEVTGTEKSYFLQDFKQKWQQNKSKINHRYNNGQATCTMGSYLIAMMRDEYEINIADGEFNGNGHWFPVVTLDGRRYIADIGNNVLANDNIEPIFVPFPSNNYTVDEFVDADDFVNRIYPTIQNY